MCAVAAQRLVGLERAARLDVEEAVEHQDRQVIDVAAEAPPLPPLVERRVDDATVDARAEQAGRYARPRLRRALQAVGRLRGGGRADQPEDADPGHRVAHPSR